MVVIAVAQHHGLDGFLFDDCVSKGEVEGLKLPFDRYTKKIQQMHTTPVTPDAPRSTKVSMRYSCRETIPGLFVIAESGGNNVETRVRSGLELT
jgi:hypothetical protein